MKTRLLEKKLNRQKGSATMVEMTFVFPLVILVVIVLLYMGLYNMQKVLVNSYAQRAAQYVSRMVAMPGYSKLGLFSSDADFQYTTDEYPGPGSVNSAYLEHLPYRFWNTSGIVASSHQKEVENRVVELCKKFSFLVGDFSCKVDVQNYIIMQDVSVTVTQTIKAPGFLTFFGIPKELKIINKASAPASCPTEFVRNVDLIVELVDVLLDKLGIGSVDSFINKFRTMKNKFGL